MKFSVVIPTYNRISSLQQNLASLTAMEYSDFEIIVVNDGSTDGTDRYLAELNAGGKILSITGTHAGPAAARNAGIAAASGEWIAFTDDDCTVPPSWLQRLEEATRSSGANIVGGSVVNALQGCFFSELSQEMANYYVATLQRRGRSEFLTSNNISYRTSALRTAGGFDHRFRFAGGEERDLNRRILSHGGSAAFISDITVSHAHRMNLRGWLSQQRNYGRGAFLLRRMARLRGESSPAIPFAVHFSLCRSWLMSGRIRGLLKAALFIVGQTATLAGYLEEQAGL
jgi:glycosyltransferase involved in cell wall biosynthesis